MKFLRFEDWSTGALVESDVIVKFEESLVAFERLDRSYAGKLRDLLASAEPRSWRPLIEHWAEARDAVSALIRLGSRQATGVATVPVHDARLRAPLPAPKGRIFAIAANFMDHAVAARSVILGHAVTESEIQADLDSGLEPSGFFVLADSVVGPQSLIIPPRGTEKLDYEAEVAVVVGSRGRYIGRDSVAFWGCTAWNDFSIRDPVFSIGKRVDGGRYTWALAKNFESGNACGPWMVVDEGLDIQNVLVESRVNGEIRQTSSTHEMMFRFDKTVELISEYVTVMPGDIITSGTPAGTAIEGGKHGPYLMEGDIVDVYVEGVGTLRNTVSSS